MTWTFFYRRLTQNPNYYNLQELSASYINDYLSDFIESCVEELQEAKCVSVEGEIDLLALNLGIIASYYYIRCETIDNFSKALNENSKMKEILEVLVDSKEFQNVSQFYH